jgi:inosose dehydratase
MTGGTIARPRVGLNPLPWYLTAHGFDPARAPDLPEILRQVRAAGFRAVHADPPPSIPVAWYRALLGDAGLDPAPGYFQAQFEDPDTADQVAEQARVTAARHAELGLDRIFIAAQFGNRRRAAAPATGAGFDQEQFDRIVTNLTRAARAMAAEGVIPCLHQHVGTLIETASETERVLSHTDPDYLLLGPDTGHLAWAGIDPVAFISEHRDRVGAVHLKDVHLRVAADGRDQGISYSEITARHLWTEPGCGDLDLDAALAALGDFNGWIVAETDIADKETPLRSAEVSAQWISEHTGPGNTGPGRSR